MSDESTRRLLATARDLAALAADLIELATEPEPPRPAAPRRPALPLAADTSRRLLADLREVFSDCARLLSRDVVDRLREIDGEAWGSVDGQPLDSRTLARLLAPYGVRPRVIRFGGETARGYRRGDFREPWRRHLGQA